MCPDPMLCAQGRVTCPSALRSGAHGRGVYPSFLIPWCKREENHTLRTMPWSTGKENLTFRPMLWCTGEEKLSLHPVRRRTGEGTV